MPTKGEEIDSLFVRLGLQQDEDEFKKADNMFRSLKTKALQFGAAIGSGIGLNELTFGFANATEKAGRFARIFSTTPEFIDALGFALQQSGGDAEEAYSSIEKVANLIENTDWGNVPSDAFRVAGFDPMMLQGVRSIAEAYERIASANDNLSSEASRRSLSALGFGQTEIDLFTAKGSDSLKSLIGEGLDFSVVTSEMTKQGKEFNSSVGKLSKSVEGVARSFSSMFIDDLTGSIDSLTDIIRENNESILSFLSDALPYLEATAVGIGALVAAQVGKKGLGLLLSPKKYAPVLAASGLYAIAKDDDVQDLVTDPNRSNLNKLVDSLVSKVVPSEKLPPEVQRRIQERNSSSGVTNNISVDARGSSNPSDVESAARRGVESVINKLSEQTIRDMETPIK